MKSPAWLAGIVLSLGGALTIMSGGALNLELEHATPIGLALGAVVGLVPDRPLVFRLIGFAAGFVLTWTGYAALAVWLPDTVDGTAVMVFLVLLAFVLFCAVSRWSVPLWSPLVGAAMFVGTYEETVAASPVQFVRESSTAVTMVLPAAAVGFLIASLIPLCASLKPKPKPKPVVRPPSSYLDDLVTPSHLPMHTGFTDVARDRVAEKVT
ncbi:MAG: hypothetical protein GEU93_04955 [Propionibacteriales bacterium]|nr:hypothetical protein [Propionibacteriales bacterium]